MSAPAELVVQIGDRPGPASVQVRVPARYSDDGRRILYAGGPGGWFGSAAILAELVGGRYGSWVSRVRAPEPLPLRITSQNVYGRWKRVPDWWVPTAGPEANRGAQSSQRAANRSQAGRR